MRLLTALFVFAAGALWQSSALAADTNKDKIVGQWKVTKSTEMVPPGLIIEFTKAGKVVIHLDLNGKAFDQEVGTYTIEGDKITLNAKKGDKEDKETNTIKSLTADKLILVDPKNKETELERVKK